MQHGNIDHHISMCTLANVCITLSYPKDTTLHTATPKNVSKYTIKLRELRKNVLQSVNKTTYAISAICPSGTFGFTTLPPGVRNNSRHIVEITSLTYIVIISSRIFFFTRISSFLGCIFILFSQSAPERSDVSKLLLSGI